MNAARKYYWNVFEGDGEWPQTKKGQTQFTNRAEKLAREFQELSRTFASLRAGGPSDDGCRSLMETLENVGLDGRLRILATQMEEIASRSRQPLTGEQRRELLNDLRDRDRTLEALLAVAEWIEDEVKAIRGNPRPGRAACGPLPEEIEDVLISSERSAQRFVTALGSSLRYVPREEQAAIEFLGLLLAEEKKLDEETEAFSAALRAFTDSHWELAEQRGHRELLRFLDLKEDVLRRVKARRGIGIRLLRCIIEEVKRRLSYDDDSEANVSVHLIIPALNRLGSCLDYQGDMYDRLAEQAANERGAATARESNLPEWIAIMNARTGDGSRLAELDKLVAAFRAETGDGEMSFGTATINDLRGQLDRLFPAERPFSSAWVRRHLEDAKGHGIVVPIRRERGQSRRLPHEFQLSAAAIRKYGPHVSRGPRLQSD